MDFPMDIDLESKEIIVESDISDKTTDAEDPEVQKKYKMMLSLWLSFCLVGFVWFVTKVLKGRQRIKYNFSSIEEQLKRMQAVIEERERAMADKAITNEDPNQNNEVTQQQPKVSPDAQKLLEDLSKAFNKSDSEDLENVEEIEENVEDTEVNGNINMDDDYDKDDDEEEDEEIVTEVTSRRRKFIDNPLDEDNVELIRDTIEDIIQEGIQEVDKDKEPSKKDN
ncbi:ring-infected erythrocyte surface antigen-like [Atheta coriaria]|uniref:ring-infected erythrocyte surface antigen-like n=1 Tax=Dalotia coriaria TaxID=877792 RepID=UPI0031F3F3B1